MSDTRRQGQPHLHLYRERYGNILPWAEPVDWYDVSKPLWTFERFLDVVRTRFRRGIQVELHDTPAFRELWSHAA